MPPIARRGEGCYLFDANGKAYLDGSGGAAVSCLGHGDPDIIDCELPLDNRRSPGYRRIEPHMAGNRFYLWLGQHETGRYSKAHYHGSAAVLVDCGVEATNHIVTRQHIDPVAIIDHHTNGRPPRAAFVDVRTDVAASASIVASYLREQASNWDRSWQPRCCTQYARKLAVTKRTFHILIVRSFPG